jgi:S-adenosylhomocysteine hydrolase
LLGAGHALGLIVTDGDDVGAGVSEYLAEQVAHVEVVEVDACDAPAFHGEAER